MSSHIINARNKNGLISLCGFLKMHSLEKQILVWIDLLQFSNEKKYSFLNFVGILASYFCSRRETNNGGGIVRRPQTFENFYSVKFTNFLQNCLISTYKVMRRLTKTL